VFQAIHDGAPDERLLSYQYLQMLPQLARGEANKIFVIPSEFTQALGNLTDRFAGSPPPKPRQRSQVSDASQAAAADAAEAAEAAREAAEEAKGAETPGGPPSRST
jgi:hypothetical protein